MLQFRAPMFARAAAAEPGFAIDFTTGSLPPAVTLARSSGGTYYDDDGVMQLAGEDAPRFDHDPATLAPRGLMVEPAATNLNPQGNTSGWATSNVTQTTGIASPDGGTNATTLTDTTADNIHYVARSTSETALIQRTVSAYLKKGTGRYAFVQVYHSSQVFSTAVIDFDTGAIADTVIGASATNTAQSIKDIGGGWYRLSATVTGNANALNMRVGGSDSASPTYNAGSPTYLGTSQTRIVFGAQIEVGAAPTSYIPTTGSAATRAADVLTVTVPAGYSSLLITYDDGSTGSVACATGPNVYTAADFARHRIKSMEGVA